MSPARFVSATVALLALATPLRAAENASAGVGALLAKHRAFVGWQLGDGTLRTLRLSRTRTNANGEVTERTSEYRVGIVYRNHSVFPDRGGAIEDSGFTGNVFWSSNQNGFTTPVYGELAKFRLSYDILMNEGTSSLAGTALGGVSIGGKQYERIRLDVPHADAIDVDVDPESGAYVRAIVDPDGDEETTVRILSYADASPGKQIVGSFRIGEGDGSEYRYTTIVANAPIGDDELHPPEARASWSFSNPQPFPINVTPTRTLVDAVVNGVKGRFILDTGASGIFLNEAFADRIKAQKIGAGGNALGLYGATKSDLRKVDTLRIGGNTLSNLSVVAEDFTVRDYRGLDRQNYDGLLGYDVFAAAVVTLDFRAATMTIADPGTQKSDPEGLGVLADTSLWIPMVPMTLNRTIAVNAMLDTGSPAGLVFGPDLLYRYHLRMARSIRVRAGMGSVECGNIDSLAIGPITYTGEMACKLDSELVAGRKILVGLDFLRHFTVVFDYPRGRLFLQLQKQ